MDRQAPWAKTVLTATALPREVGKVRVVLGAKEAQRLAVPGVRDQRAVRLPQKVASQGLGRVVVEAPAIKAPAQGAVVLVTMLTPPVVAEVEEAVASLAEKEVSIR
jgi:hypothetical protein